KLVQDVYGIGFKTADKIAQALGLAADDPNRIEAGIAYTLNRMAEDGHVYMPQESLEPEAAEILGLETEKVTAVIDHLETGDFIGRFETNAVHILHQFVRRVLHHGQRGIPILFVNLGG
ncbi:MAG: hypothetical protein GY805_20785, partial [Chloroflexi bacterium]|nr:hypothetical protein [Chloroflexota bacterium]